ncbi:MAG: glycosyltransferase 87 family protein [Thaumarchaeota archaeon]|nr:glycosyltransferase 87 family protein [Nitrososphaerota archaeon]
MILLPSEAAMIVPDRRLLVACISSSVAGMLLSVFLHSPWSVPSNYSDIGSFWGRSWVIGGQIPNSSPGTFFEYPPISGLILYAARALGGNYDGYYLSISVFSLIAVAAIAWSAWRLASALGTKVNPLYFLLPSIIIYGVYNFDLFNALFIVLSLQFFVEKRRGWSAVFLGLAVATKLVAGVLLPVFFIELASWKDRSRYLATAALVGGAFLVPIAIINPGFFNQFYTYFSNWGLEDAWYIFIFGDQFSRTAKLFGLVLMLALLVRIYTLKNIPMVQRAFLTLTAYLLSTYIYAPQFNVMMIPIVAVLALTSPALYFWEAFNALIILTWFTYPDPTHAWTLPQTMALLRSAALAMLGVSVASASGHPMTKWFNRKTVPAMTATDVRA